YTVRSGLQSRQVTPGHFVAATSAKEDVMALAKCAHPACNCTIQEKGPFGKYCSEHCKKAGNITELRCGCQHADCR
ncbi:MAG TPA: hypothetical protein VGL62_04395, partial [Vicinamibacterales bacterium]